MSPTAMEEMPAVVVEQRQVKLLDSLKKAAFVIGTALFVFVAARNSITWHLEQFWGASGDLWQSQWVKIHSLFGGEPFNMAFYGTAIVTNGVFWFFNFLLMLVDLTNKPDWVVRYKIQSGQNQPVDKWKLLHAVRVVLFNQIVIGAPVVYAMYRLMLWRGCGFGTELPTFPWVVWELFVMILTEEVCFYYSHRLLHHPRLYKHIHKVHHEWTAPIGLVSLYAHPLEHFLSNLLPPMLGPILCGSHIATAWMWFSLALISTTISHSGYHLPFLPSPEAHDYHHLKFNQNYGVLGVLDRLHGTDAMFRRSKAYERHYLAVSLVPLTQLIPEEKKK